MMTSKTLIRGFISQRGESEGVSSNTLESRDDLNIEIPVYHKTGSTIVPSNVIKQPHVSRMGDERFDLINPMKKFLCRTTIVTEPDMNIGLRLALPDKVAIMKGLEVPSVSYNVDFGRSPVSSPKKLIIVPDNQIPSPLASFRRKSLGTPTQMDFVAEDDMVERKDDLVIRTSEQDPSVHQLIIPSATDLLIHARICIILEDYDRLLASRAKARERWFDFNILVKMDRAQLETTYLRTIGNKPILPVAVETSSTHGPPPLPTPRGNPFSTIISENRSTSSEKQTADASSKTEKNHIGADLHPSIIRSLLECSDDLIVEGYFTETIGQDYFIEEENNTSCIQVAVFSSHRQRQFIVCYRGSRLQHSQPVEKRTTQAYASGDPCLFHPQNPFPICSTFKAAYFEVNLERKIFDLLSDLASKNPFCDVVFTGHSFAGVLATLGSLRYAEKFPMMTVSCHVFGSPKIGGSQLRQFVHSLPNLNVIRVEYGLDYCVDLPTGPKWEHVGHTIKITPFDCSRSSALRKSCTGHERNRDTTRLMTSAIAFKFGKKRNEMVVDYKDRKRSEKLMEKDDHEMRSYLHALEQFTHHCSPWITSFYGEEGEGIVSLDNEERCVS